VPYYFKMGMIGEERPKVARNAIPFEEAFRVFVDWHSRRIPIQISFLGPSGLTETMLTSIHGLVTKLDSQGIVTVSGNGCEITLSLHGGEFSYANGAQQGQQPRPAPGQDPVLQLTFPSGAVCLIFPSPPVESSPESQPRTSAFRWLRNKPDILAGRKRSRKNPPADLPAKPLARRNILVDVRNGEANIVELIGARNGGNRIRRLKEQFLPNATRMQAERLKRQIVHAENGGAYTLDGLYQPKTESSFSDLLQFVEELEEHDGPSAWDRRRHSR